MRPDSFPVIRVTAFRASWALVGVLLIAACGDPANTPAPTRTTVLSDLPQLVSKIALVRSRVRDDVIRAFNERKAGAAGPDIEAIQRAYQNTQAKFNAWILEYQTAVDIGQSVETTNANLQKALISADQLLTWTDEWHTYNSKPQGAMGAPVGGANGAPQAKALVEFAVGLLPELTDAGISVWNEAQKADQARQDEVIHALERAMWPDWGKL
jgi:hypothetical protein